jgi:hypothetical protein
LAAGGLGEETMGKEDMMPVAVDQATLWTLNADRLTVRLALPPLPLADLPPINVKLDFDAAAVDAMLERLSILRGQMLPARKRQQDVRRRPRAR